jgi:flagellar hook-basal body complex protein FliE
MPTPSAAAQAYASLARIGDPMAVAKSPEGGAGPNFGALLKEAVGALNTAARNSDSQTQAMVAETEVTIDALVSIRDKVIAAYEEIMRMPI